MIDVALRLLASELDQSVQLQSLNAPSLVALTNLVDSTGAPVRDAENKLAVFLVSLEREDIPTRALQSLDAGRDRTGLMQPPVHLSLLVMFAATFSGGNYDQALKLVGATISFFQSKPVFTHANTPTLDDRIEQLSLEIENLPLRDLSALWGALGGRYLPSVLYRLRMVTIDARQLETQPRRIEQVAAELVPSGAR